MRYKGNTVVFALTELLALFVLFYLNQPWHICIQEYDWMKESSQRENDTTYFYDQKQQPFQ